MPRPLNVTRKLIQAHLADGDMTPDAEIGLKIDQTLTQDATGTLVMLELEAMGLDRVRTEVSVQYVDHNLLQTDHKNPDDHLFLLSACRRFGVWYSRAGNGVSHPVHMERFGVPGKSLAGSDSHTPAAGALGMLALGSGGMDVAFAMAGEPLRLRMPRVLGVELTGKLPEWVSAKDVVLEMLRRYDVKGCKGLVIEYYGAGLECLSAMDRHVIANMGTEMGATTTVFPSDGETRRFLASQGRLEAWSEISPDQGAEYDLYDSIDLASLEPLLALPGSPGRVRKVREAQGLPIYQAYIGSSANPGLRDFWVPAEMVKGRVTHPEVSFDVNPTSRQLLENLAEDGALGHLVRAGARLHQAGCNGCIGMGQAPATGRISLRTVPRNFPGRSGTREDQVYLCSPETAAASALTGEITDPRDLEKLMGMRYPRFRSPEREIVNTRMLTPPLPEGRRAALEKGPNIKALPEFPPLVDAFRAPVLIKMEDDVSTDEILRAGAEALPFRSNIPEISKWTYYMIDAKFHEKALQARDTQGGHIAVAGENYAQGSSREHAAIAPRYLGQIAVIAKSYARIGWQNLINFGIVPLEFRNPEEYQDIAVGDLLSCRDLRRRLAEGLDLMVRNETRRRDYALFHRMSDRQTQAVLAGGVIGYFRQRRRAEEEASVRV
ncbi:MAG: dmdA [Fibrobacteres bacterium]|nr:dmdA [Fibrobacterota bacterium]